MGQKDKDSTLFVPWYQLHSSQMVSFSILIVTENVAKQNGGKCSYNEEIQKF